jgi:periplasmic copper chaperone A
MRRYLISGLLLVSIVAALGGCTATPKSNLTVSNIRSNACKAGDDCGVFLTIANSAAEPDVLVGAKTDIAEMAGLHTVVKDDQGGMKMTPVENIPVPASGSVELKPGSLHVMLMKLRKDLRTGDTFPLTLSYQKAGDMTVQVKVQPAN